MFFLTDFAQVVPDTIIMGDRNIKWQDISIDTRTIKKGDLFVAIKGEKYDGHHFIREAIDKGSAGVVIEEEYFYKNQILCKESKYPLLVVKNTLRALQDWAHYYLSLFKSMNICITGSNGKTTTKEMIAHLLARRFQLLKSKGNYNNEIGVPLTVLNLTVEHNVLIQEMAAQKIGEIKELAEIVQPDVAIITNIGEAHIGLFGNKDNIAREKSEILKALPERGTAIVNRDDNYFPFLVDCVPPTAEIISFGFHPEAKIRADNFYQKNEHLLQFDLLLPGKNNKFLVSLPMMGRFNVLNALAAIAVALKMAIPVNEIISDLADFAGISMHMEYLLLAKDVVLIQDYYNANPSATKEALQSVTSIGRDRLKIAVLGDMLELGEATDKYHKEVGQLAASLSFDILAAFGDFARFTAQGALEKGMSKDKIFLFKKEEKKELGKWLKESLTKNSIILLKGSRGMKMEEIVENLVEEFGSKGSCHHV